jgi:adenosylhomocysteine nucleosidase
MTVRQRVLRRIEVVRAEQEVGSVIAVTGLSFEARIAGGIAVINDGVRTAGILRAAILRGSRGVISFGVCGGLTPEMVPGQWVVASAIVSGDEIHHTDKRWSDRLILALPAARHAIFAGVDWPLTDARDRGLLHARTGAVVADMESHVAAQIAAAHSLPFAACRVVINPAHRKLSPAALLTLREGGVPDIKAIRRSVLANPGQMADLMRLTVDVSIAISALRRGKLLIGPTLGVPDLALREPEIEPQLLDDNLVPASRG